MGVMFLTNSSTDLDREHYLCSTTQAFAEKLSLTYPLLSDVSRETVQKYGMMVDDPHSVSFRLAQRAYVVIDQQGIIRYQRIMEDPDHALDAQEIFTIVQKIVAGIQ
jgi:peroxiredoxin